MEKNILGKNILSGVEWCVLDVLSQLQKLELVPSCPWDVLIAGDEVRRGYDQGFGGKWEILERQFIFKWETETINASTTLTLLMRGEIPLSGRTGKQMESKEAQRRWFADTLKIQKPTGRIDVQSPDDVMRLINPRGEYKRA